MYIHIYVCVYMFIYTYTYILQPFLGQQDLSSQAPFSSVAAYNTEFAVSLRLASRRLEST